MTELKIGQEVELEYGGTAKVLKVIGSGGQGVVYLVEFNGMQWALKWYDINKIKRPKEFRNNIQNNINDGAPSNKFLWPKYLTKEAEDGTFGYIMDLKPEGFDSFVDILNTYKLEVDPLTGRAVKKDVKFSSLTAMITAVINIVSDLIVSGNYRKRGSLAVGVVLAIGKLALFKRIELAPSV